MHSTFGQNCVEAFICSCIIIPGISFMTEEEEFSIIIEEELSDIMECEDEYDDGLL